MKKWLLGLFLILLGLTACNSQPKRHVDFGKLLYAIQGETYGDNLHVGGLSVLQEEINLASADIADCLVATSSSLTSPQWYLFIKTQPGQRDAVSEQVELYLATIKQKDDHPLAGWIDTLITFAQDEYLIYVIAPSKGNINSIIEDFFK